MAHKEPIHVLVADDSAVYRKLVEHALPSALFPVLLAKNGLEAIELFDQHRPEMVITDWVMPYITWLEVSRRIRESSEGPYTYIIILTSVTQTENVVRGLAAGADDYLTKPFHAEELLARGQGGRRSITFQRHT